MSFHQAQTTPYISEMCSTYLCSLWMKTPNILQDKMSKIIHQRQSYNDIDQSYHRNQCHKPPQHHSCIFRILIRNLCSSNQKDTCHISVRQLWINIDIDRCFHDKMVLRLLQDGNKIVLLSNSLNRLQSICKHRAGFSLFSDYLFQYILCMYIYNIPKLTIQTGHILKKNTAKYHKM